MDAKEHIAQYLTAQAIFEGEIDRRQEEFTKYLKRTDAKPNIIHEHNFHISEMNKFMQTATKTIMQLSMELELQTRKANDIQHIIDNLEGMKKTIDTLNAFADNLQTHA